LTGTHKKRLPGGGQLGRFVRPPAPPRTNLPTCLNRNSYTATDLITATAHKLARIFYTMMRYGVTYQKQSEAEFVQHNRQRLEKSLRRRAKELGFELKKIEAPPPDPAATTTPSD